MVRDIIRGCTARLIPNPLADDTEFFFACAQKSSKTHIAQV